MTADNSTQLPYQACLMPNLPEAIQHRVRDITNHVVIPLNMLMAVMSFVCNGFVVITVARTKSLQQPPLLVLASLAITDVLLSKYALFRFIEISAHKHMCPENVSAEKGAVSSLCLLATLGNLAVVSRDRYLAVTKPWWYRTHVTKSRAIKMICVSWCASALISFLNFLSVMFKGQFPPLGQIMSLLFYLVCFFVIVFSYLGLFCKRTPTEEVLHIRAILEREKRKANTVALILLVLLVTLLPGLLISLVLYANGVEDVNSLRPFYSFLLLLNGLVNPLLNFGRSKEMRRALRNLLKCPQQVQPSTAPALGQLKLKRTTTATTTNNNSDSNDDNNNIDNNSDRQQLPNCDNSYSSGDNDNSDNSHHQQQQQQQGHKNNTDRQPPPPTVTAAVTTTTAAVATNTNNNNNSDHHYQQQKPPPTTGSEAVITTTVVIAANTNNSDRSGDNNSSDSNQYQQQQQQRL